MTNPKNPKGKRVQPAAKKARVANKSPRTKTAPKAVTKNSKAKTVRATSKKRSASTRAASKSPRAKAAEDASVQSKEDKSAVISLLTGVDNFLISHAPLKERIALGKAMRENCSRKSHAGWTAPKQRPDPLELLRSQDADRIEQVLPLRYGRMMESPFAFYRGAALIMASDLSFLPRTKLIAQLCGDCHLSNFGVFATQERNVIFDLNDFDETLPGPIEWDIKRLAASFVVAANTASFNKSVGERCVYALAREYRKRMEEFAQSNTLQVWYKNIDFEYLASTIKKPGRKQSAIENLEKLKDKRNHSYALMKLTTVVDGKRKIKDDPPVIIHPSNANENIAKIVYQSYSHSLWESRQRLLQRYRFVDAAMKVVGVGSVGTAAFIMLLQGEGSEDDFIFLQLKEAKQSVLERYLGRSQFTHAGQRIVNGQRLLQASHDLFFGWTMGPQKKVPFYVRQLMDGKASLPVLELDATTLEQYATVCAYALARAHARSGDAALIHGYLGTSDTFDEALCKFAVEYAKQNEKDYEALVDAINKGKIAATPGI